MGELLLDQTTVKVLMDNFHLYDGDSQTYVSGLDFSPECWTCISSCLFNIFTFLSNRHVKLNMSNVNSLISLPHLSYLWPSHLT